MSADETKFKDLIQDNENFEANYMLKQDVNLDKFKLNLYYNASKHVAKENRQTFGCKLQYENQLARLRSKRQCMSKI